MNSLHQYFVDAARRSPDAPAVIEPGAGSISYGELDLCPIACGIGSPRSA